MFRVLLARARHRSGTLQPRAVVNRTVHWFVPGMYCGLHAAPWRRGWLSCTHGRSTLQCLCAQVSKSCSRKKRVSGKCLQQTTQTQLVQLKLEMRVRFPPRAHSPLISPRGAMDSTPATRHLEPGAPSRFRFVRAGALARSTTVRCSKHENYYGSQGRSIPLRSACSKPLNCIDLMNQRSWFESGRRTLMVDSGACASCSCDY